MTATARQARLARADENCRYVRELLEVRQPLLAALLRTTEASLDTQDAQESEVTP